LATAAAVPKAPPASDFNLAGMNSAVDGLEDGTLVTNGTGGGGEDNASNTTDITGALVSTGYAADPYAAYTGTSANGTESFETGTGKAGAYNTDISYNPNTGVSSTQDVLNPADDSLAQFATVVGIGALPIAGGLSAAGEFGGDAAVGAAVGEGSAPEALGAGEIGSDAAGAASVVAPSATVDAATASALAGGGGIDATTAGALGVDTGASYLPATGVTDLATLGAPSATGLGVGGGSTLDSELGSEFASLGGSTGAGVTPAVTGAGGGWSAADYDAAADFSATSAGDPMAAAAEASADPTGAGLVGLQGTGVAPASFLDKLTSGAESFASNPKNLLSLGLAGASLAEGTSKPALPAGAQTASSNATGLNSAALGVINSGGYSAPGWAAQKASIDASINQQEQQQTEALLQNQANTGQTGMVSAQQTNALKQNLETQRQELYAQALATNVQQAISEYTGSNQTLLGVANLQYQESAEAKQSAAQLAGLAAKLYSLSGTPDKTPNE
jgi:hypothetical protein